MNAAERVLRDVQQHVYILFHEQDILMSQPLSGTQTAGRVCRRCLQIDDCRAGFDEDVTAHGYLRSAAPPRDIASDGDSLDHGLASDRRRRQRRIHVHCKAPSQSSGGLEPHSKNRW